MISSPDNQHLKTIRKLADRRWREKLDLFTAEGEDLVEAAEAAGWEPEVLLVSGEDVDPPLLDEVSSLGSGTRVVGVYRRRFSEPGGEVSLYLNGVHDPGNVGTVIRTAHALCDGPVVLGPGCADPFSPKAVRGSMGSLFARPPARAGFDELAGTRVALYARAPEPLGEVPRPAVLCLGGEREGLPGDLLAGAEVSARIPLREDGAESLNVAAAAAIGLYELQTCGGRPTSDRGALHPRMADGA
ncbi:MAG: RNA methyltransferase [Actinomycetota bacterium]|nr:RNA methyltransferase [Actinomycetota bacterium]